MKKTNLFFKNTSASNENKNEDQPGAPQSIALNPIDQEYKKITAQMEPILSQFEDILLTCGNQNYDDIVKRIKDLYGPSLKLHLDLNRFQTELNEQGNMQFNTCLYAVKYSLTMIESIDKLDDIVGYKGIVGNPMRLTEKIVPAFLAIPIALKMATENAKQKAAAPKPQERSRCTIL